MNGGELLFIILLVGFFVLFLWKLANIFMVGKLYNTITSWIAFIGNFLIYGVLFLLTLSIGSQFLYASVLFSFMRYFLLIYFVFHIIEVLLQLQVLAVGTTQPKDRVQGFRNS